MLSVNVLSLTVATATLSVNMLTLTVATAMLSVNVTGYRYIAHLYCLAVQAGFYNDVVECSLSTRENLVRSPLGKKEFFFSLFI